MRGTGWHLLFVSAFLVSSHAQVPLTDYRIRHYPEVPFLRLEDHNITYLELQGVDPQTDDIHTRPEQIIVRLFLAAQHERDYIKLKVTIMRESLASELEFGEFCSPTDRDFCTDWYWQCPTHPWQPNITLSNQDASFAVHFMTDAPGVWSFMRDCKHFSNLSLWSNNHPYYAQALLPPSAAGQTFHVSLAGFTHQGLLTLRPQDARPAGPHAVRPVWNVMKPPGVSNNDKAYASSLALHAQYHLAVGYAGTLAIVSIKDATALLIHKKASRLIASGKLQLLLWEGYAGCQGFDRCYAEDRFAYKWPVAYQPLQFSVAALFLWRYHAHISFADMDEFLMINQAGRTASDLLQDDGCWGGISQVLVPHHMLQSREVIKTAHWAHWHRRHKHDIDQILSEYIYRSQVPDETAKPIFLGEEAISCTPHYVIMQTRDDGEAPKTEEVNATCATWGHIRDWWGFRGQMWIEARISPQEDKAARDWAVDTRWMWALQDVSTL